MSLHIPKNRCWTWCLLGALLWPPGSAASERERARQEALDCVINPSVVADLGSAVPGVLSDVRVDRSDFVEKGAVLAELESGAETATVDLARAKAGLTAEVELRRANAAFGNRQHERSRDLFERKVLSTNEMDERRTEARIANIQLRQALDNQELAQLELVRAEEILKRRVIHSPISGVVMERFKSIGEYVEDQPVVRVAQLDPLHVEVIVPVEQLGSVEPGMRAEVWVEALGEQTWQATVSRVDRVADVASGTYGVRLALPNPEYRIPAGLRCRMSWLEGGEEPQALSAAVPGPAAEADGDAPVPAGAEIAQATVEVQTSDATTAAMAVDTRDSLPAPVRLEEAVDESAMSAGEPVPAGDPQAAIEGAPAAVVDVEPTVEHLPVCRLAGPFDSAEEARKQAAALRAQGLDASLEQRKVRVRAGSQVVVSGIPSRAAVDDLLAQLAAAGVSDHFVKNRQQPPYEISLGLYRGEQTAGERVAALRARGFDAVVIPWLKVSERPFLAISGALDETTLAALAVLPQPEPGMEPAAAHCERLARR